MPLIYKNALLDCGYRLDILVEERLPLELKAVSQLHGIHDAQLLTYLRLGKFPLGLLINFNVAVLKDGIRRKVESRVWEPPTCNNHQSTVGMDRFDGVSRAIVHSAIEVHRQIGPGMLASTYEECLCYELVEMDISFQRAMTIPLVVDGECLGTEALVPVVVANEVPVFPMCVEAVTALQTAAALARLRQGGWNRGLILNFHSETMLKGIKRVVL